MSVVVQKAGNRMAPKKAARGELSDTDTVVRAEEVQPLSAIDIRNRLRDLEQQDVLAVCWRTKGDEGGAVEWIAKVKRIDVNRSGVPTAIVNYTHNRWYDATGAAFDTPLTREELSNPHHEFTLPPGLDVEVFEVAVTQYRPPYSPPMPPQSPPPPPRLPRTPAPLPVVRVGKGDRSIAPAATTEQSQVKKRERARPTLDGLAERAANNNASRFYRSKNQDMHESLAFVYECMGTVYTLPDACDASVREHVLRQRPTDNDYAEMEEKFTSAVEKALSFCASCGNSHLGNSREYGLDEILTLHGELLFQMRSIPEVTEAPGSTKRWDGGVVHVQKRGTQWQRVDVEHAEAKPVALYSALVPSDRVRICIDCQSSLQKKTMPTYNVSRWHMTAPPGFAELTVAESFALAPVVPLNTILTVNGKPEKFTGHFLSVRKTIPSTAMLPRTDLSAHVALTVTGTPWVTSRVHQLVHDMKLHCNVDRLIWALQVLEKCRPDEYRDRIDRELIQNREKLKLLLEKEVEDIVTAAQLRDPDKAQAVSDVVDFLSNATADIDDDDIRRECGGLLHSSMYVGPAREGTTLAKTMVDLTNVDTTTEGGKVLVNMVAEANVVARMVSDAPLAARAAPAETAIHVEGGTGTDTGVMNEWFDNHRIVQLANPDLFPLSSLGMPKGRWSSNDRRHLARFFDDRYATNTTLGWLQVDEHFRHAHAYGVRAEFRNGIREAKDFIERVNSDTFRNDLVRAIRDPKSEHARKIEVELGKVLRTQGGIEWTPASRKKIIPFSRSMQLLMGPMCLWSTISTGIHNWATPHAWRFQHSGSRNTKPGDGIRHEMCEPNSTLHSAASRISHIPSLLHARFFYHLHGSLYEHVWRVPLPNDTRTRLELEYRREEHLPRVSPAGRLFGFAAAPEDQTHTQAQQLHMHQLFFGQLNACLAARCLRSGGDLVELFESILTGLYTADLAPPQQEHGTREGRRRLYNSSLLLRHLPVKEDKEWKSKVMLQRLLVNAHFQHTTTCVSKRYLRFLRRSGAVPSEVPCRLNYARRGFPTEKDITDGLRCPGLVGLTGEQLAHHRFVQISQLQAAPTRRSSSRPGGEPDRRSGQVRLEVPTRFAFPDRRGDMFTVVASDDPCIVLALHRDGFKGPLPGGRGTDVTYAKYGVPGSYFIHKLVPGNQCHEPCVSLSDGSSQTQYLADYTGKYGDLKDKKLAPMALAAMLEPSRAEATPVGKAATVKNKILNRAMRGVEVPRPFGDALRLDLPSEIYSHTQCFFPFREFATLSSRYYRGLTDCSQEIGAPKDKTGEEISPQLGEDDFPDADEYALCGSDEDSTDSEFGDDAAAPLNPMDVDATLPAAPHHTVQERLQPEEDEEIVDPSTVTRHLKYDVAKDAYKVTSKPNPYSAFFTANRRVVGQIEFLGTIASPLEVYMKTQPESLKKADKDEEATARAKIGRPANAAWHITGHKHTHLALKNLTSIPIINCQMPQYPGPRPSGDDADWRRRSETWAAAMVGTLLPWVRDVNDDNSVSWRPFFERGNASSLFDRVNSFFAEKVRELSVKTNPLGEGFVPEKLTAEQYVWMGRLAQFRNSTMVNHVPSGHRQAVAAFRSQEADKIPINVVREAVDKVGPTETENPSLKRAMETVDAVEDIKQILSSARTTKTDIMCDDLRRSLTNTALFQHPPDAPDYSFDNTAADGAASPHHACLSWDATEVERQAAAWKKRPPWEKKVQHDVSDEDEDTDLSLPRLPGPGVVKAHSACAGTLPSPLCSHWRSPDQLEGEQGPLCAVLRPDVTLEDFWLAGKAIAGSTADNLSEVQTKVLRHFVDAIYFVAQRNFVYPGAQRLHVIQGLGGAGKSHVLRLVQVWADLVGGVFGLCAFTGSAATILGKGVGTVFHLVNANAQGTTAIHANSLPLAQQYFRRFVALAIDEWSMMNQQQLGRFSSTWNKLSYGPDAATAGLPIPVFLVGDCHQIGPRGNRLFDPVDQSNVDAVIGANLFREAEISILPSVPGYGRFTRGYLKDIANVVYQPRLQLPVTFSNLRQLHTDDTQTPEERKRWYYAVTYTTTHRARLTIAHTRTEMHCSASKIPYYQFNNVPAFSGVLDIVSQLTSSVVHAFPELIARFYCGQRVMIVDPLNPQAGVCNGTRGTLVDFVWDNPDDTEKYRAAYAAARIAGTTQLNTPLPKYALVMLDEPDAKGNPKYVPIGTSTKRSEFREECHGRRKILDGMKSLCIEPLWAVTLGKAQGTQEEAIYFFPTDNDVSSSYSHLFVMLTRVADASRIRLLLPLPENFLAQLEKPRYLPDAHLSAWIAKARAASSSADFPPSFMEELRQQPELPRVVLSQKKPSCRRM